MYGRTVTIARRLGLPVAFAVVLIAIALGLWEVHVPIGIDFHTYEAAAQVGVQQGWSHIYDQAAVASKQLELVPGQVAQPFLSPPTTAWLAALLAFLPYWPSYYIWSTFTLVAFALALLWSSRDRGLWRWVTAGAALAPWWVAQAEHVGQVVPLVAVGMLLAWRLIRERRDLLGGAALALLFLKPNTAFLVPLALAVAGRFRAFLAWAVMGALVAAVALITLGPSGISSYVSQLTGSLPLGADSLTLGGALGVTGPVALGLRIVIVGASLVAAFRFRESPGLVIAVGTLGSLLVVPYLHGSDLCLLSGAAFIVWQERTTLAWRIPIAAGWVVASPFIQMSSLSLRLNRWPLIEMLLLAALVFDSSRPRIAGEGALTAEGDLKRQATA